MPIAICSVLLLLFVNVFGTKASYSWPDCSNVQGSEVCSWHDGTEELSKAAMLTNGCECDSRLRSYNVTCSCTDQQFLFNLPGYVWLGFDNSSGELFFPDNETDPMDYLIVTSCTLNYCKRSGKSVSPVKGDFDVQCVHNRTGVLCGSCDVDLSSVFGSTECWKCANYSLFLILAFAIAGIFLFAMLSFLQMTVDKGWLYIILLYSNLVSLFVYFWGDLDEYYLHFFFLPTAFLSLQLGSPVCFYNGMSTVARAGLQFVFPTYLFLLMLLFTLLARRFSWFSKNFSPVKTFASLMMMSYISILGTCVEILGPTRISTLGGKVSYRWSYDPTQKYFQGVHLFLGIYAIVVVLIYIIPFPIVLFSPFIAYKYTKKFAPFYDAFWAPFRPKYRFWLSFRILLLFTIITLSIATDLESCLFYSVLALLIFILVQLSIRPFKSEWQSRADTFLVGNAIALKSGAIFVLAYDRFNDVKFKIAIAILTIVALVLAYCIFIAIIYYTLAQRYPVLKKIIIKVYDFLKFNCTTQRVKGKKDQDELLAINTSKTRSTTNLETHSLEKNCLHHLGKEDSPVVSHTEVYISMENGIQTRNFTRPRESLLEPSP